MREFQKKFFDLLDAKQFTEAVLLWELHLKNLNPLSENNCFDIKHILQEAMLSRSDALEIFFISGKSDSKYTTPIVLTYYYAAIKIVEYIIQTHHAKSNDAECYGCVLLLAASKKEWDLCRLLLNQGVKLTYMDAPSKYTALHFLAMSGQTELTMLAIQRGANITAVGRDGKTPLQLAIDKRHWPLLALLVPITDEPSCYAPLLSEAAAAKAWDFCYALLQKQKVTNITALYHFAKHEKLSLAANVIFGNYFYSDEESAINAYNTNKSIRKLY